MLSLCHKERDNRYSEEEQHFYIEQFVLELLEMFSRLSYGNDRRFEDGQKAMSTELSKLINANLKVGQKG